jgi:His-Xaa-Ser system radical SAM maturase HxsB
MDGRGYRLLPFQFVRWDPQRYFLANLVGEHLLLDRETFATLVAGGLSRGAAAYADLKGKHFLRDAGSSALFDVLAAKYRTKKSFLDGFTKLHIFVTTLRCDQSCQYCQVSRQSALADHRTYDMEPAILERSVRLMLASPAPHITMEFQGGEPLVAFELVEEAVRLVRALNARLGKTIDLVLCTNLTLLEDRHLDWCRANEVAISTSLDGPAVIHDRNRPLGGAGSHAVVVRNIRRAQEALGRGAVSALMTTTRESLRAPREIVDEYLRLDLGSMFVRELNPYGFAVRSAPAIGYETADFLAFYRAVIDRILEVNRSGRTFSESYATLVLTKILTPWPVGFVDLQSPSGAGVGACVYNYDGDVYASDESRMMAESGDKTLRLGNALADSYEEIFFGETMQAIAAASCNESLAGCADCAFQAYCGADPVRHYRLQGDLFGRRSAFDGFCGKNMGIVRHLLELLHGGDPDIERIFWAWIRQDDVNCPMPGR